MTACREFLELMSASLDQDLSRDEQAQLDSHLAECPTCPTAWKDLQWTHSQIKGMEAVEPPPWLASKIMARIRAEAVPQTSFWRRFIRPIVLKPQLQVASILLLAATGFYLLKSQRSQSDVFGEMKQQKATAPKQSQPAKSVEATDKLTPESRNQPREMQKPRSEGMDQSQVQDSKQLESGFAQPPPKTSTLPVQAAPSAPGMAKQERDEATSGPPLAAPPTPSALAGASVGGGVAVVAESEAIPTRQAKKTSKGAAEPVQADRANRAGVETREKAAEATGQLMDQAERKDKSDGATWAIRLKMADPKAAKPLIERELVRAGGAMIPQREPGVSRVLSARLDRRRLPDLLSRLARIGKVLEQPDATDETSTQVTVSISW